MGANQRPAWRAVTNQRAGINHSEAPSIYGGDLFTFQGHSWGGILSLKLNKILILHGSNLWKGWRDFSLMKTSQSSIGRSRLYDHLLLTKIKFKYFPRVTKYSFRIWFATSRLWVICVNIPSRLCLSLCPGPGSKYSGCWRPSDDHHIMCCSSWSSHLCRVLWAPSVRGETAVTVFCRAAPARAADGNLQNLLQQREQWGSGLNTFWLRDYLWPHQPCLPPMIMPVILFPFLSNTSRIGVHKSIWLR